MSETRVPDTLPDEALGDVGRPDDGTLDTSGLGTVGALDDLYYRRVWTWDGARWNVVGEGPVRSYGPNCVLGGPTWCSIPEPHVFERWWRWSAGTYGSASSSWVFVADLKNW